MTQAVVAVSVCTSAMVLKMTEKPNDWALNYIKMVMSQLGVSASELAARAGMASTTLTRPLKETGEHPYRISRSTLEKIRDVTGIPFPDESGVSLSGRVKAVTAHPPASTEDPEMVQVPVFDVEASAGHGALVHAEEQIDEMAFAAGFVRSITTSDSSMLAIIRVKGDSMEPTMLDGDKVLIDRSKTSLDFDGIYVLRYGQALHIKRVGRHRRRGWVTITSDNDQYREIEAEYSDVDIVGRVLWFGRKV